MGITLNGGTTYIDKLPAPAGYKPQMLCLIKSFTSAREN